MSEIPKFSETLWEWRSFSKTFHESLLSIIQELPLKFDRPAEMIDNYVWTPDCSLNIKLREQDLKIKEFLGVRSYCVDNTLAITTHVERWTTEVYSFPIPLSIMKRIVRGLNLSNMSGLSMINDKDQFINLLQSQSNSVRVSSIFKQRKQHLLCTGEDLKEKGNKELGEFVTVEISHLILPEDVFTLSVEHVTVDNEIAAISKIVRDIDIRAYRGMVFMNYLQAVKEWGLNKKIFD
jgi:hypothetical protein